MDFFFFFASGLEPAGDARTRPAVDGSGAGAAAGASAGASAGGASAAAGGAWARGASGSESVALYDGDVGESERSSDSSCTRP